MKETAQLKDLLQLSIFETTNNYSRLSITYFIICPFQIQSDAVQHETGASDHQANN